MFLLIKTNIFEQKTQKHSYHYFNFKYDQQAENLRKLCHIKIQQEIFIQPMNQLYNNEVLRIKRTRLSVLLIIRMLKFTEIDAMGM